MNSENHFAPIAALDLDPIKVKLMHEESGEGWTLAYADEVEFEYRRFLYLMKKFPNEQAAPLFDVDVFWHYHILDTMKYAADCEAVFGYFLHHFPYVGLRGEEDLELHHSVGERMRELYEHTYGKRTHEAESEHVSDVAKTAWCSQVAYAANVAYSMSLGKVAYSMSLAKVAYSQAFAKVAYSQPCSNAVTPAASGAALDSADDEGLRHPAVTEFCHVRPTLLRTTQ